MKKFYEQAFWFYSVIVGFAIREALTTPLPRIFPNLTASAPANLPQEPAMRGLEAARLVLFLLVICRFYLGGGVFFEKIHWRPSDGPSSVESADRYTNFQRDFISGFVHFILFFVWSLTISRTRALIGSLSSYLILMSMVLGWGSIWWLLSQLWGRPAEDQASKLISVWAMRNCRTLCWCALLAGPMFYFGHPDAAEYLVLIVVGIVSIKDFWEMTTHRDPQLWPLWLP